ncbi:MAG: hypothetical protein QOC61_1540 [Acidobacteriota bacterium]|jgi:hypothetical protein|nr:hypothetical protein [Acidobacteriota bacterium]MDT5262536.1 hypothetical protein [Acidobacteriota bacterium]
MKSVWVYAPTQQLESWFDALSPSLREAGIEPELLAVADGPDGASTLQRSLASSPQPTGGVLCVSEMTDPLLSDINRACRAAALPLLLISPSGASLQVGPGVVFGTSPCLACFKNHTKFLPLDDDPGSSDVRTATPRPDGQLVKEVVDFFNTAEANMLRRGYVFRAAPGDGAVLRFRIFKNPTCLVCSVYAQYPTETLRIDS